MNPLVLPDMQTEVGARRSSFLYLKGIKLNWHIVNTLAFPVQMHLAILQDKEPNNSDATRRSDFFRDTTSATGRSRDFPTWASGAPYDFGLLYESINGDKYNVITHMKMNINGYNQAESQGKWFRMGDKYYKINRRIAFNESDDTFNYRPFYICAWWTPIRAGDYDPLVAKTGLFWNTKTDVVYKNLL